MGFESWLYTMPLRVRALFRREQMDQELRDELDDHIEQETKANVERGMTPAEARSSALHAMRGVTRVEEMCRETRRVAALQHLGQDLRYGLRQLRRSPGFSALAILCLTLGIGANAAVFSWVEGILFRPYPAVTHQERMLALAGTSAGRNPRHRNVLA